FRHPLADPVCRDEDFHARHDIRPGETRPALISPRPHVIPAPAAGVRAAATAEAGAMDRSRIWYAGSFLGAVVLSVLALRLRRTPPEASLPGPSNVPFPMPPELIGVDLLRQNEAAARAKSAGCIVCHRDAGDPHAKDTLRLGCTDCHGGD